MDDQDRRTLLKFGAAALISAGFILSATFNSERALAETGKAKAAARIQMLFSCRTDSLYTLQALPDDGTLDWNYKILGRRKIRGGIRLNIDSHSHAMTLFVQSRGELAKAYILGDIEQGNTPLSGGSGHLGTVIRGKSGNQVFTLFAEVTREADEQDAVLQVDGPKSFLLPCADDHYLDSSAKGLGRFGSINIYGLSRDGLAKELKEIPTWPEYR